MAHIIKSKVLLDSFICICCAFTGRRCSSPSCKSPNMLDIQSQTAALSIFEAQRLLMRVFRKLFSCFILSPYCATKNSPADLDIRYSTCKSANLSFFFFSVSPAGLIVHFVSILASRCLFSFSQSSISAS